MIKNWDCEFLHIKNMTDELNLERVRNLRNTIKNRYNCGGYALENFAWYCPYSAKQDSNRKTPFHMANDSDELATMCVDNMIKEYNGKLRVINNVTELKPNEYAIAFKATLERNDFHFAKLGRNGVWYHKRGSYSRIEIMSKEELYGETWCCGKYDSKLTLLAMKRK